MDLMGPMFMIVFMGLLPVAAFFWMRTRTVGRMLCWIMDDDRSAKQSLVKVQGDFVTMDDERYVVHPDAVRLIRYPTGWPNFMQQIMPCALYQRGNAEPINWNTSVPTHLSSMELGSILDPNWMRLIVRGTKDQGGTPANRMITFATLGIGAVSIVIMFYLVTKLGTLQGTITELSNKVG